MMDGAGQVLKEAKFESEPSASAVLMGNLDGHYRRVGLEAEPLSQWLYSGLATSSYTVICVDTRHMKAALSAQINETDRNDARGIAQMMHVGLYRPVHVKIERSQELRMLLTALEFLQSKIVHAENNLRGLLRKFGLKVGAVTRAEYEARVIELHEQRPHLAFRSALCWKCAGCCASNLSHYIRRWGDSPPTMAFAVC